jgi:transposase-like protein
MQDQTDTVETLVPTCPLCHTVDHTVTATTLEAGASWNCTRCGQTWSARRLAAVAAYKRYKP